MYQYCLAELIQMVSLFKNVEAVKVSWYLLARIVAVIKRP
jgi:hypothetical protein